jgi:hypothetical protein
MTDWVIVRRPVLPWPSPCPHWQHRTSLSTGRIECLFDILVRRSILRSALPCCPFLLFSGNLLLVPNFSSVFCFLFSGSRTKRVEAITNPWLATWGKKRHTYRSIEDRPGSCTGVRDWITCVLRTTNYEEDSVRVGI